MTRLTFAASRCHQQPEIAVAVAAVAAAAVATAAADEAAGTQAAVLCHDTHGEKDPAHQILSWFCTLTHYLDLQVPT